MSEPPPPKTARIQGMMMFQGGRDWWRFGHVGPTIIPGWELAFKEPFDYAEPPDYVLSFEEPFDYAEPPTYTLAFEEAFDD